jgi:preprotein translocase subunit SecE
MPAKTRDEETELEAEELDEVEEEVSSPSTRGITAGKGRATPSRRRQEEAEEETGNVATRGIDRLREYFEGVRSELGKVIWPTREETRRLTIIVLIALIISSLVLGAISLAFTELFKIGLGTPIILLVVMFIGVAGGYFFLRWNSRRTQY